MTFHLGSRLRALGARRSMLRDPSTSLYCGFMLANLLAYVYQMLLSRALSPADYGATVTLTSIFFGLAVFWRAAQAWVIDAVAGTGGATARPTRAVFVAALRTLLPLGAIVFAVHWLASARVMDFLELGSPTPVIVLGLYVASSFLLPVAVGLPLGLGRLYLASGVIILEPVARVAVGLALISFGLGLNGALAGYAAGNFVAFAVTLIALWPLLVRKPSTPPSVGRAARRDRFALLALAVNAGLMTIASVDLIVVKHFFSDEVAGNYAVAFLLGRITSTSAFSLAWVIFARSAAMPPADPRRARLLFQGLRLTGAVALTLTAAYLVAPTLAVRMMGGSQYSFADQYVGLVGIEMAIFSLAFVQVYYHLSTRNSLVLWPIGVTALMEMALLIQFHSTIQQVLLVLILVMGGLLAWVSLLSWRVLHRAVRTSSLSSLSWQPPGLDRAAESSGGIS